MIESPTTIEEFERLQLAQIEKLATDAPPRFYGPGGPTAQGRVELERGHRLARAMLARLRQGGAPDHLLVAALVVTSQQGDVPAGFMNELQRVLAAALVTDPTAGRVQ